MSPEEITVEEMCDDERWRSLKDNPPIFGVQAEPEPPADDEGEGAAKGGAAIGFDYNNPPPPPAQPVQPEGPSLKTLANVLEKTAEFIASQVSL